jgi:esterase/lipase superfamily enzyme
LVTFTAEDASRATRQWIGEQPEALRAIYNSVYEYVKTPQPQSPAPPIPGRRSESGTVYFATTREETTESALQYKFGDVRTDVVKCGKIQFRNQGSSSSADFDGQIVENTKSCGAMLDDLLASSTRMLIFVHGFNNRFSDAVDRAIILKNALGADTTVVLWSWPSKRDGLGGNYDYDKESVSGAAQRRLTGILRAMKLNSSTKPINILAHSMGGWHVLQVLETLSEDNDPVKLTNVIFAAPDIPADEFGFGLPALSHMAERNTLYACGWDWALVFSQDMNDFRRAGTGGNNIVVSKGLDSIDVDASFSLNHSYVFETGKVLDDLTAIVTTGVDPDAAPRSLSEVPKDSWHYWKFNP